jgi:hypothetical protein
MTDPTDVAGVLWSSVSSALTLACIRTHGQREAAALEYEAERRQHELTLAGARPPPTALRDTVVRAWSASSPHHAWDIRARLMPPVAGDGARRVLFDRGESGDRPADPSRRARQPELDE